MQKKTLTCRHLNLKYKVKLLKLSEQHCSIVGGASPHCNSLRCGKDGEGGVIREQYVLHLF